MQPHGPLSNFLIYRLLEFLAISSTDDIFLAEALMDTPGLPQRVRDVILGTDPVVEQRRNEAVTKVHYKMLSKLAEELREAAPYDTEFSSLAEELEESAARLNPEREAPGPSASPSKPEEEWLRRNLASLDIQDSPPSPQG
ncbi:MAG: hypothetical protein R3B95_19195 [Nitrospirales bacterium]|nr:hypothetical protein [Nitrospirales bacterium]